MQIGPTGEYDPELRSSAMARAYDSGSSTSPSSPGSVMKWCLRRLRRELDAAFVEDFFVEDFFFKYLSPAGHVVRAG
ncbi:hypothetical protein ACHAWF_002882 [Thalassiosira exigua]